MASDPTLERAVEWVSKNGYATGWADTIEDLLEELLRQTEVRILTAAEMDERNTTQI